MLEENRYLLVKDLLGRTLQGLCPEGQRPRELLDIQNDLLKANEDETCRGLQSWQKASMDEEGAPD